LGHHRKSRCRKYLQLRFLQVPQRNVFCSSSSVLDSASSGRTGSQMYRPDKTRPSSDSRFPPQAGMSIGGIRRHCPLHIPSQLRSWLAVGHNTTRPQPHRVYRPSIARFHFSAHRNSPAHRPGFCTCFDRAYIGHHQERTGAKRQGQTSPDFGREFLQALPGSHCQLCERTQHKTTIPLLFPGNSCRTFCTWP